LLEKTTGPEFIFDQQQNRDSWAIFPKYDESIKDCLCYVGLTR